MVAQEKTHPATKRRNRAERHARARLIEAHALFEQDEYEHALERLKPLFQSSVPEISGEAALLAARIHEQRDEPARALAVVLRAIRTLEQRAQPDCLHTLHTVAAKHYATRLKRFDEALEHVRAARKLRPNPEDLDDDDRQALANFDAFAKAIAGCAVSERLMDDESAPAKHATHLLEARRIAREFELHDLFVYATGKLAELLAQQERFEPAIHIATEGIEAAQEHDLPMWVLLNAALITDWTQRCGKPAEAFAIAARSTALFESENGVASPIRAALGAIRACLDSRNALTLGAIRAWARAFDRLGLPFEALASWQVLEELSDDDPELRGEALGNQFALPWPQEGACICGKPLSDTSRCSCSNHIAMPTKLHPGRSVYCGACGNELVSVHCDDCGLRYSWWLGTKAIEVPKGANKRTRVAASWSLTLSFDPDQLTAVKHALEQRRPFEVMRCLSPLLQALIDRLLHAEKTPRLALDLLSMWIANYLEAARYAYPTLLSEHGSLRAAAWIADDAMRLVDLFMRAHDGPPPDALHTARIYALAACFEDTERSLMGNAGSIVLHTPVSAPEWPDGADAILHALSLEATVWLGWQQRHHNPEPLCRGYRRLLELPPEQSQTLVWPKETYLVLLADTLRHSGCVDADAHALYRKAVLIDPTELQPRIEWPKSVSRTPLTDALGPVRERLASRPPWGELTLSL